MSNGIISVLAFLVLVSVTTGVVSVISGGVTSATKGLPAASVAGINRSALSLSKPLAVGGMTSLLTVRSPLYVLPSISASAPAFFSLFT